MMISGILTFVGLEMSAVSAWITNVLEPRNEYGMTAEQAETILAPARKSLQSYDAAVEVALIAYELSFPQIDRFFDENGVALQ